MLLEPIQGEAGVLVPPAGYLPGVRELTRERNVLFIADEIQSGLGRTGRTFACEHEGVVPDMYVLGKALGGGVVPVSAVVSSREVLGVFRPGEHGSTFGGNPLACAVALEVIAMLRSGEYQQRATELGEHLHRELGCWSGGGAVDAVRGRGLWAGVDIDPSHGTRPGDLREADGPRCAGQGHPWLHDPDRAAAGDQQGGPGLGADAAAGRSPAVCRAREAARTAGARARAVGGPKPRPLGTVPEVRAPSRRATPVPRALRRLRGSRAAGSGRTRP